MDTLEQMLDVHDTITTPLDDFDLVIEPFYKSTCLPIKKVICYFIHFSNVFKNVSKQCNVLSFTRFIQFLSANFARLFVIFFSKSSVHALHTSAATFN